MREDFGTDGKDDKGQVQIMICIDCDEPIPSKRVASIIRLELARRCVPCQSRHDRPKRAEEVSGMAVVSEFDSTREHWEARQ